MRGLRIGLAAGAFALSIGAALAQSAATPTSPNAGPNPGAAATDQVTNPTKPPGEMAQPIRPSAPSAGALSTGAPAGRVEYTSPPAAGAGDMREMVDLMRAAATAARESVDYQRVVPDILTQILVKLDKLEDKPGKVEAAIEGKGGRKR